MLIGIKMALVFALLGGTLWWLRRHDRSSLRSARRGERPVAVLAQSRVGKTASVAVVRIGNDAYAIGVTEQSVSLLVPQPVVLPELEDPVEPEGSEPTARSSANTPPSVGTFVRAFLGGRRRVQYLDVELPASRKPAAPAAPATDGSVRGHAARKPEPVHGR